MEPWPHSSSSWPRWCSNTLHKLPPTWMMLSFTVTSVQSMCSRWLQSCSLCWGGGSGFMANLKMFAVVWGLPPERQTGAPSDGEASSHCILSVTKPKRRWGSFGAGWFVPNFGEQTSPLTDLTQKVAPDLVLWMQQCQVVFHVKPCSRPNFFPPVYSEDWHFAHRAGGSFVAAGKRADHPVVYFSWKLSVRLTVAHLKKSAWLWGGGLSLFLRPGVLMDPLLKSRHNAVTLLH